MRRYGSDVSQRSRAGHASFAPIARRHAPERVSLLSVNPPHTIGLPPERGQGALSAAGSSASGSAMTGLCSFVIRSQRAWRSISRIAAACPWERGWALRYAMTSASLAFRAVSSAWRYANIASGSSHAKCRRRSTGRPPGACCGHAYGMLRGQAAGKMGVVCPIRPCGLITDRTWIRADRRLAQTMGAPAQGESQGILDSDHKP